MYRRVVALFTAACLAVFGALPAFAQASFNTTHTSTLTDGVVVGDGVAAIVGVAATMFSLTLVAVVVRYVRSQIR